jgi:hypothetical protein
MVAGIAVVAIGCGGAHSRLVKDVSEVRVGDRVRIEGPLTLRGSTPFTILTIEAEGGESVQVECEDIGLLTELKGLAGLPVSIEGTVAARLHTGMSRIVAASYEMLPLPTGDVPIVGSLSVDNGQCVLTTRTGERYWIRGDLLPAIREHAGARIWIVGGRSYSNDREQPAKSTPFTPTGYGVIDVAPAR